MIAGARLLAAFAVAPLLVPLIWDPAAAGRLVPHAPLAALTELEQPLSIRSLQGAWAMALAVAWFALAYRSRSVALWEVALLVVGGMAALLRLGNAWIFGLAVLAPLARQVALARPMRTLVALGLAVCAVASGGVLASTRPASVPDAARVAARSAAGQGAALTSPAWARPLQSALGSSRVVLGAPDPRQAPDGYWEDYLRISLASEQWSALLDKREIGLLVLDARGANVERATVLLRASALPGWRTIFDADGALVAVREP